MERRNNEIASAKRLQVVLASIVALFAGTVVLLGTVLYWLSPIRSEPSVDQLIGNYRAHRAAFASMVRMAGKDPDFAVWNPPLGPQDERYGMPTRLAASRQAQYRKLLAEIGGTQMGSGAGELSVTLGSDGFVTSGRDWGYFHTARRPESVDTTEHARAGGSSEGWCVPLGDGWYANLNRD